MRVWAPGPDPRLAGSNASGSSAMDYLRRENGKLH
jgi:hypothetical protein